MEITKFPLKTSGLECPCCGTVGSVCFSTEHMYDPHNSYDVAKIRCSRCGYYLHIYQDDPLWSEDEKQTADNLIASWKKTPKPNLNPCKLCGKKPHLSYQSWLSKIQCRDCGVAVSGGKIEKAVETWNNLMDRANKPHEEEEVPLIDDDDWEPYHPTEDNIAEMYRGMAVIVWGSVALLAVVGLLIWGAIKLFS